LDAGSDGPSSVLLFASDDADLDLRSEAVWGHATCDEIDKHLFACRGDTGLHARHVLLRDPCIEKSSGKFFGKCLNDAEPEVAHYSEGVRVFSRECDERLNELVSRFNSSSTSAAVSSDSLGGRLCYVTEFSMKDTPWPFTVL